MLRPITRSVVSPGVRAVNSPIGNAWYSDPVMTVALTTSVGGTSYIYFNADSSTNPDNCLKVKVVQSTGEIALARRVGGSDTSLISVISTLTTPDNITIVVEKASDYASSTVSLFHNGVQKGLTQTINSAGIINNKIHYLSGDYGSSLLKKRRFALSGTDNFAGWDFTSAWTWVGVCTINDLNTFTSTGNAGITKTGIFTAGKVYKITFLGSTAATSIGLRNSNASGTSGVISNAFGSFIFLAGGMAVVPTNDATALYIRNEGSGATDITTLSAKEVILP